jgi:hypothetical protein
MGLGKGRRMVDSIFIIRTILIGKYLGKRRNRVNWLFVDLQKAFGTVMREVLW